MSNPLTHLNYSTHQGEHDKMLGSDLRHNSLSVTGVRGYATDLFTQHALKVIKRHDATTPLYLHLSYPNTHCSNSYDPLQAPSHYVRKFESHLPNVTRRTYAANLYTMDESVGQIFRALASRDLLRNSVVLFTSDNGAGDRGVFPNHGSNYPLRGVKGTLWEGAIRVPSFVWSPLIQKNPRVYSGHFHVTDWLPTLLDAARSPFEAVFGGNFGAFHNQTFKNNLYGISHWTALKNGLRSPRNEVLHNIDPIDRMAAIRFGDFKLVVGANSEHVSGWYGGRFDNYRVKTRTSSLMNPTALREVSAVRSVLTRMGRKPNYGLYQQTHLHCLQPNQSEQQQQQQNQSEKFTMRFTGIVQLFNISNDPCEQFNIASQHGELLELLNERLRYHELFAVAPRNQDEDPDANPVLHGGAWVSWRDAPHALHLTQSVAAINTLSPVLLLVMPLIVQMRDYFV